MSKHQGTLYLNGLTTISDAAAESLAKYETSMGQLNLTGLTELSDAAAESLSKHQGYLSLYGLRELSDAAAESLSKHQGGLDLHGLTELSDAAADSLSKHQGGDLSLNGLTELSDAAAESLSKHQGNLWLTPKLKKQVAKAGYKAAKLKGTPKMKWDPDFLKGVKARWKKSLGIDGFTSAEQLLATLTSQGTSPKEIVACMEANDMCMGGDSACERAVKVGWLTGAWDVSWTTFQEAMESQSPDEMAQQAAELIADAVLGDNAK